MIRRSTAFLCLLLCSSVAMAFVLIDDTHDQTVGGIKTHVFPDIGQVNFATLAANILTSPPADGQLQYCTDCLADSSPCTGGGSGAMATRVNGQWDCGVGACTAGGSFSCPTPQVAQAFNAGTSTVTCVTPASGSCPGGSATQFQWNNASSCDGTSGMTWDSSVKGWTLAGGTLPADGSKNWIHETGTFTGTASNTPTPAVPQAANFIDVTGNGVGNRQVAQKIYVESGYTGTNATLGLDLFNNTQAVVAPTPFLFYSSSYPQGNYAAYSQVANSQAGNTVGFLSDAVSGAATLAAGFIARVPTSNTGHNIGVGALANAQGGPGHAGYFILHGSSTQPTLYTTTNAAVVGAVAGLTNGAQFLGLEGEPPVEVFRASRSTGSAINGVDFESANTGNAPSMNATSKGGSPDTNVSYGINPLGTGAVKIKHPGGGGSSFTAGAITCGGGSPDLHGTDSAFQITSGTGACTFSWKSTWNHAPACACSNQTTPANTIAIQATTTLATIVGTKVDGELINCICQSWTD